jgi:serine-type D-Ala-D-Ala carboxypeptidase/endopeptidase
LTAKLLKTWLYLGPTLALTSCGGASGTLGPPGHPTEPFAALESRLEAAAASPEAAALDDWGFALYDRHGRTVFQRRYGNFEPHQDRAVASAAKLVTSLVLMRLVDQQYISLDDTTGAVLGWRGPQSEITLRHLLSLTSGLPPDVPCLRAVALTLAECVQQIEAAPVLAGPGQRFDYGGTPMQVAARMAEVVTGAPWNDVVHFQLAAPLGLSGPLSYYTYPRERLGSSNPRAGGGLVTNMEDYAVLLGLVLNDGMHDGMQLISPGLVAAIMTEPYPDATIGNIPALAAGLMFRYGLGGWLECDTPAEGCAVVSSPGGFGWTPWIDRDTGYAAILGMQAPPGDGLFPFSVLLAEDLKPLIREALQARTPP